MFIPLAAGQRAVFAPWPHAKGAPVKAPWNSATLVLAGDTGAVLEVVLTDFRGHEATHTYTLTSGKPEPAGDLTGVAVVALARTDATAGACSAMLNRW